MSADAAQKLGLVDEIGGLDAAIAYAVKKAGVGADYALEEYPEKKDLREELAALFDSLKGEAGAHAQGGVFGEVLRRVATELHVLKSFNEPSGLYARLPEELAIR